LASVAEKFGMSATNLTHHFKTKLGKTVMSYLDEIRIAQAKKLLSETDLPLSDQVHQVGYFDVSNFIKKFKKHTGTTPGRYRSGSLRAG
jgi:AraC-like DNA-binding protein